MAELPNILYVHSHDTGRWVEPCGAPVPTPRLAQLAREGVLFRRAFSCAPTCSPSRAALLTGQVPHAAGMVTNVGTRGGALRHPRRHVVHLLRAAGYATALGGLQHVSADPATIGYDAILPGGGEDLSAVTRFLRDPPTRPFFLSVGFRLTHRRRCHFQDPPPDARSDWLPPGLPDCDAVRADVADFIAAAGELDRRVGAVLDALDAAGRAGDTLVLATTDHGPPFPGYKMSLRDGGVGVFLILRGPGGFEGGQAVEDTVSHLDVLPTLCRALDLEPPAWLQGQPLPTATDEASPAGREAFSETNYHAAYEPQRAVRTDRWTYIRRFHDHARPIVANLDDSPTKDAWLAAGGGETRQPAEQLYDLSADPAERVNLADDPARLDALTAMRDRLADWMQRTADPLLHGPVPAPPHGRFNHPDDASPLDPPILPGAEAAAALKGD